jgi:hypothetical protein
MHDSNFKLKPGHIVYGSGNQTVIKQDGHFYHPKGIKYPDDPDEIIARGLFLPAEEIKALRLRKKAKEEAQAVMLRANIPAHTPVKIDEGPIKVKTLAELQAESKKQKNKNTRVIGGK